MLDDLGLVAAMEWQLGQFGERTGLKCCLDSRADDSGLDRARSTALFRVSQELLTNVARHAGASAVRVSFELDNGRYILTVTDDGRGIAEEEIAAPGSLGLIGMRERVRPFGGEVDIEGVPKGGTTVRVYVPAG
jgi:two-component system sensor histidine kinase UhpB